MLKKLIVIMLSVALILGITPMKSDAATKRYMSVHFINIGQGDAIYIKGPYGEDILIDGGNNSKGNDVVNYLKKQKVDDIEILIATHPDADHIGGLDNVLKAFNVENIYAPKVSHTTQTFKDFLTAVKNEKKTIKTAQKGVKLSIKGVTASFVAPVKTYSKSDLNNWSAVVKMTYGKKSFLFTGDAETKSEKDMINSKQNLTANVIKIGHHGAKTSTSPEFLNKVKPQYAIISDGKNNSYGHPTSEVLNRLKSAKVNVYRTDKQGTIIAKTDGSAITFNTKPAVTNSASSTSTAKPTTSYKLTASLNTTKPKQYGTVNLTVKGLPSGTNYKAVFHYKSTNTTYSGKVGQTLPVKIGRAAKGYRVTIDVSATYKGKTYKTTTSFVPQ